MQGAAWVMHHLSCGLWLNDGFSTAEWRSLPDLLHAVRFPCGIFAENAQIHVACNKRRFYARLTLDVIGMFSSSLSTDWNLDLSSEALVVTASRKLLQLFYFKPQVVRLFWNDVLWFIRLGCKCNFHDTCQNDIHFLVCYIWWLCKLGSKTQKICNSH